MVRFGLMFWFRSEDWHGERRDGRRGGYAFVGGEVESGDLDGLQEESGALEVHVVACEASGDLGDGVLDGRVVVEALDEEWVVLDDGGDVVVAVVIAHVLVVHGGGAASGSVFLGMVHALVRLGRFAVEILVVGWHVRLPAPPGGIYLCC
jgi:hypothetical protein